MLVKYIFVHLVIILIAINISDGFFWNMRKGENDSQMANLRRILKQQISNVNFHKMRPYVIDCFEVDKNKFEKFYLDTHDDYKLCGGKNVSQVLQIFEDCSERMGNFSMKLYNVGLEGMLCNNKNCVDAVFNALMPTFEDYLEVMRQKSKVAREIYSEESDTVQGCVKEIQTAWNMKVKVLVDDIVYCATRKLIKHYYD